MGQHRWEGFFADDQGDEDEEGAARDLNWRADPPRTRPAQRQRERIDPRDPYRQGARIYEQYGAGSSGTSTRTRLVRVLVLVGVAFSTLLLAWLILPLSGQGMRTEDENMFRAVSTEAPIPNEEHIPRTILDASFSPGAGEIVIDAGTPYTRTAQPMQGDRVQIEVPGGGRVWVKRDDLMP